MNNYDYDDDEDDYPAVREPGLWPLALALLLVLFGCWQRGLL